MCWYSIVLCLTGTAMVSEHFWVPTEIIFSHLNRTYFQEYRMIWPSPRSFFLFSYKVRNMRKDFTYSGQKAEKLLRFSSSSKFYECPSSLRQKESSAWILRILHQITKSSRSLDIFVSIIVCTTTYNSTIFLFIS